MDKNKLLLVLSFFSVCFLIILVQHEDLASNELKIKGKVYKITPLEKSYKIQIYENKSLNFYMKAKNREVIENNTYIFIGKIESSRNKTLIYVDKIINAN